MSQQQDATAALVVVGSINRDACLVVAELPAPGETVIATGSRSSIGGKGANQALAAARAGARVEFVGAVGPDAEGDEALRTLREIGIGTRGITSVTDVPTGRAWVTVDASGENSIVVAPGANHALTSRQAAASLRSVVTSTAREKTVVLCQGELSAGVIDEAARLAIENGWRFILNLAPFALVSRSTLAAAQPLIVNETEAQQLLDHFGLPAVENAAPQLSAAIGTSVVVTLGGRGAAWADGELHGAVAAHRVARVVDTTGAGDAFVGAVAASLCVPEDLAIAVRRGSRAGADAVQHFGSQQ
jgi:ribokinase